MPRKSVEVSALPLMLQQLVAEQLERTCDFAVFDSRVAPFNATPDAYILTTKPASRTLRDQLLKQPDCSVVVLSDDDDRLDTYELQICHRSHNDASMQELIEALRVSLASSFRQVEAPREVVARVDRAAACESPVDPAVSRS